MGTQAQIRIDSSLLANLTQSLYRLYVNLDLKSLQLPLYFSTKNWRERIYTKLWWMRTILLLLLIYNLHFTILNCILIGDVVSAKNDTKDVYIYILVIVRPTPRILTCIYIYVYACMYIYTRSLFIAPPTLAGHFLFCFSSIIITLLYWRIYWGMMHVDITTSRLTSYWY